jgi:hypothetical protein
MWGHCALWRDPVLMYRLPTPIHIPTPDPYPVLVSIQFPIPHPYLRPTQARSAHMTVTPQDAAVVCVGEPSGCVCGGRRAMAVQNGCVFVGALLSWVGGFVRVGDVTCILLRPWLQLLRVICVLGCGACVLRARCTACVCLAQSARLVCVAWRAPFVDGPGCSACDTCACEGPEGVCCL